MKDPRVRRVFGISAILASTVAALAQVPAPPLTLDQAVSMAAAANPQVTAANAGRMESAAGLAAARASLFPKVGVSESFTESTDPVFAFGARLRQGRFTAEDFNPSFLNSPGPTADNMSTAGASWTIYDAGATRHQIRAARSFLTASEQHTESTQQGVAFAAIRAYYRALLADDEKSATSAAVQRAQAFAKQAHDRVETGMALVADAMQADVEVSERQEDLAEAESNAELAYADLAGILGDPGTQLHLGAPTGTPSDLSGALPDLEHRAVLQRPDLLAFRSRIAGSDEETKASRSTLGPQLSTFGSVQADNPHPFSGGASNWTVGAKLEWQVFDGGARRAAIWRASAQTQAAEAAYTQAKTVALLDVKRAFYERETAERQYRIAGDMLAKTAESLKTAQDRYGAGLVTVTDVLRQQEQMRGMEINRTQALHRWWIADAQLRLATGTLQVPKIGVKR